MIMVIMNNDDDGNFVTNLWLILNTIRRNQHRWETNSETRRIRVEFHISNRTQKHFEVCEKHLWQSSDSDNRERYSHTKFLDMSNSYISLFLDM